MYDRLPAVLANECLYLCFSPAEAPKLAHETFRAIKPGLSAYADDPEKVQLLLTWQ